MHCWMLSIPSTQHQRWVGQQSEYALRISEEECCFTVPLDMTTMSLRDLEHCEIGIQITPKDFKGIYWVH